jgi:hypothetical protein
MVLEGLPDGRQPGRHPAWKVDRHHPADEPALGALPNIGLSKEFDLEREGLQAVLGVGNSGEDRTALFQLCQEGAPVHITISSQISATRALMGPGDIQTPGPLGE